MTQTIKLKNCQECGDNPTRHIKGKSGRGLDVWITCECGRKTAIHSSVESAVRHWNYLNPNIYELDNEEN